MATFSGSVVPVPEEEEEDILVITVDVSDIDGLEVDVSPVGIEAIDLARTGFDGARGKEGYSCYEGDREKPLPPVNHPRPTLDRPGLQLSHSREEGTSSRAHCSHTRRYAKERETEDKKTGKDNYYEARSNIPSYSTKHDGRKHVLKEKRIPPHNGHRYEDSEKTEKHRRWQPSSSRFSGGRHSSDADRQSGRVSQTRHTYSCDRRAPVAGSGPSLLNRRNAPRYNRVLRTSDITYKTHARSGASSSRTTFHWRQPSAGSRPR